MSRRNRLMKKIADFQQMSLRATDIGEQLDEMYGAGSTRELLQETLNLYDRFSEDELEMIIQIQSDPRLLQMTERLVELSVDSVYLGMEFAARKEVQMYDKGDEVYGFAMDSFNLPKLN